MTKHHEPLQTHGLISVDQKGYADPILQVALDVGCVLIINLVLDACLFLVVYCFELAGNNCDFYQICTSCFSVV